MRNGSSLRAPDKQMPRLDDSPGTTLRLMVVSTGNRHCGGIDLASGALVRAWTAYLVDQRLRPYDVVDVTVASDPDLLPDPSEPDAIVIGGPPKLSGRLKGRPAGRLIRPLLHPERAPLLGSYGATVPFWERSPDHPSVALARPKGPLVVTIEEGRLWCHFVWGGRPHVLACDDPRLAASLHRSGRTFAQMRPGAYIVVALTPPVDGHCYKVVEAVVPHR
ncbi:MAG TPA: hypothetical protein VMF65_20620 [Acidimicrobiales bacterium]|nr:hypothetical protein [Acidimicrobiales bacterium]